MGLSNKPRFSLLFCLRGLFVAALVQWGFILRWHHQPAERIMSSVLDSSRALSHLDHEDPAAASLQNMDFGVFSSENSFHRTIQLPRHSSTPVSWVIFYHIYMPTHSTNRSSKALSIVREQLEQIRTSYAVQQQPGNNTLLLYTTIGQRILPEIMKSMCQPELRCVNAQALGAGFEDKTLRKVHAYCVERPNVTVTYLHNKGSHHNRQGANDLWRQHMTLAVTSRECYNAVALSNNKNASSCDACGLLFQSIPSLHFPGNFWTARCDYIRRLRPLAVFSEKLSSTLDAMDEYTEQGVLTRLLYNSTENWTTGRSRYGDEQWVASHPDLKPCDVSSTPDLLYWKTSPRSVSEFDWHVVPRRSLLDKHWKIRPRPNQETLKSRTKRLTDYHLLPGLLIRWWGLYDSFPSSDSWVWRHLPDGDYWRSRMQETFAVANHTNNGDDFNSVKYLLNENFAPETNETNSTFRQHESAPWTVFYHVYMPTGRNVSHIIEEQLMTLDHSHAAQTLLGPLTVYYSLVGDGSGLWGSNQEDEVARICHRYNSLYCERREQALQGNENSTLASLHDFCVENPEQAVVYFHSKGSFHDSVENEHWRRHLLAAVTSSDCLDSISFTDSNTAAECDVCGLQFYPIWAFFFPGNFFVGRCSYIRKLLHPTDFATGLTNAVNDMFALKKQNLLRTDLYSPKKEGNLGLDRYAWEVWVGSHPSIRPCDLSTTANFRHWVQPSQSELDLEWSMAPRQDHDIWAPWYRIQQGKRESVLADPSRRMREYFLLAGMLFKSLRLYNETPPENSWIYEWFPDGDVWRQGVKLYGSKVVDIFTQRYRDGVNLTEQMLRH